MITVPTKAEGCVVVNPVGCRSVAIRKLDSFGYAYDVGAQVDEPLYSRACGVLHSIGLIESPISA